MTTTKQLTWTDLPTATLDELTDELAAAGWDSTQQTIEEAMDAVARLFNETRDLRLYDSDTADLIRSEVTDDEAAESITAPCGHITIDGRRCYVAE